MISDADKIEELAKAIERAIPYLRDHVGMTCADDFSGVGDRIALDGFENILPFLRSLSTKLKDLEEKAEKLETQLRARIVEINQLEAELQKQLGKEG
jgi:hypothetical protein